MRDDVSTLGIREMFDSVAARYDLVNRVASFGLDERWRAVAAGMLPGADGLKVVDVCAGTGDLARSVARRLSESSLVLALDFSPKMLDVCRKKMHAWPGRFALTRARAEAMPFADCSADHACSAFALRNMESVMDDFLSELHRVLKPGGSFVLLETGRPAAPFLRWIHGLYLSRVLPLEGRLLGGDDGPYRYLAASIRSFPEPAEFSARLEAAGFIHTRFRRLSMGIATIYTGSKPLDLLTCGGRFSYNCR